MTKNILISQDLSCVGQVSLEVALPIIAACGIKASVLPTAILSTHTGGYGNNTFLDLSNEMEKIIKHWQEININFDALYLGYLGSNALDFWNENIDNFVSKNQTVLLDPAMADHGKLYRGLDEDYVQRMQILAKKATILTPNMTEAQLLLSENPSNKDIFTIDEAVEMLHQLMKKYAVKHIVLTGIPMDDNTIGMVGTTNNQKPWSIVQAKLPGSYFGTGDMFASAFLSVLMTKHDLKKSTQIAAEFIEKAILATENQDPRLGPNYALALPWLMKQIKR
ncbi:PfkB family carbohydrate kinase [Lactobacillus hamsteri]|uniref:pyridoxal kinase n=1 Tax=Lactobacillus hamsteri DSM 5661 = JCM 6256 TaxID=1423754 RepID=A0A0R1YCB2_9LACO|nr:pyridoxamine kinase [Lactobacillus hamsteri]KRM37483.1 pyridoxal kinase [Lactobacillus hamsteri DSM 5661 = JCM 6256]